ncbi:helix-turn-helix domain-containing protein [Kitasatospora sp. NPDC004240]
MTPGTGRPAAGRPAAREMGRTVHPELAAAVLGALDGGPADRCAIAVSPCAAAAQVRDRLAVGEPVPELLHRELLTALHGRGWAAVRDAGRRLFERPRDPLLRSLLTGTDLAEAFARARLVEPWLYAGHRTRTVLRPGVLTVSHGTYLGREPELPETVFVCAVHAAGVAAITGREASVVLLDPDGRELPPAAAWQRPAPAAIRGWRLRWEEPPDPPPADPGRTLVAEVRRRIALDPAATWRLAATAAGLGVAPRTLQRAFTRAGTTFQAELTAVRLDVAGHLVRRTRLPLAEVAAAAGFTDHPHLTRRFRQRYGCTPGEFRRSRGTAASPDG